MMRLWIMYYLRERMIPWLLGWLFFRRRCACISVSFRDLGVSVAPRVSGDIYCSGAVYYFVI